MNPRILLKELDFGRRVAEEEKEQLATYFVETDQWRRIYTGEVDVVYGAKGSGKSAIYSTLLSRRDDLFDRRILVETAENPQGTAAFKALVQDPPTGEDEFTNLWKLYILSLVARVSDEYEISNEAANKLRKILADAGLTPRKKSLGQLVKSARDYVRRMLNPEAMETTVTFDKAGMPIGVTGRIVFREPSGEERDAGTVSVDEAIELANQAMAAENYELWMLFDRLDVAFSGNPELEANALRALFKVYLDLVPQSQLRLRVFLRTDIWHDITAEGFREASHITRTATIDWDGQSLLNLVVRRMVQNASLAEAYGVTPSKVLSSLDQQEQFFYRAFPRQVERGKNKSLTFGWIVGRTKDGTDKTAPRELIHLLTEARDVQLRHLDLGQREPEGEAIFTEQALKDALPEVSRVRVEQTLYAEYSELKEYIEGLRGGKTDHSLQTLADEWGIGEGDAKPIVGRLVDIGFFEERGTKQAPRYWIPFLYRPALDLVQGKADD